MDAKLQEVLLDYGLEGYGLYWYCLELIAGKVEPTNLTFELEHDARIIARNTGSTQQKVQEMMTRFVDLGLFEDAQGTITCLKMAKVSDDYTAKLIRTEELKEQRKLLKNQRVGETPTNSEKVSLEENRIEQNRIEKNIKNTSNDVVLVSVEKPKKTKSARKKITADELFNEFKKNWPIIAQASDQFLLAWCQIRIDKKATHSEIAHKAIERELSTLSYIGINANDAIRYAVEKGWKGLESSWFQKGYAPAPVTPSSDYSSGAATMRRLNDTSWAGGGEIINQEPDGHISKLSEDRFSDTGWSR